MTFIDEVFAFFYRPNEKQRADIPRGHRLAMLLMQVLHSLSLLKLAYCHLCGCDTTGSLLLGTCLI